MVGLKLGTVKLGSTFEHSNAVFQHRRLPCWQVTYTRSLLQASKAPTLKRGLTDRVLGNEPGSLCPFRAD
jgi:hypothetical protein